MSKSVLRRAAGVLVVAVLAAMPGCYRKVVGAQGFGADQVTIEQPNLPDGDKTLGYPAFHHKTMPGG